MTINSSFRYTVYHILRYIILSVIIFIQEPCFKNRIKNPDQCIGRDSLRLYITCDLIQDTITRNESISSGKSLVCFFEFQIRLDEGLKVPVSTTFLYKYICVDASFFLNYFIKGEMNLFKSFGTWNIELKWIDILVLDSYIDSLYKSSSTYNNLLLFSISTEFQWVQSAWMN